MGSKVVQEVIDQNIDIYNLLGFTSANIKNLYGGPSGIPFDDIKTACKKAQFNNHPDRNGDHGTFIKIQKGIEILNDANDKNEYDNWYNRRFMIGNDRRTLQQNLQETNTIEQETLANVQEYDEILRKIYYYNLPLGDWSLDHINKLKQNARSTNKDSDEKVTSEEYRFQTTGTLNMILIGDYAKLLTFSKRNDLIKIIAGTFDINEGDIFKIECSWESKPETKSLCLMVQLQNPIIAQSIFQKHGSENKNIDLGDGILVRSITSCISPDFYKGIKLPETELNPEILETIQQYNN